MDGDDEWPIVDDGVTFYDWVRILVFREIHLVETGLVNGLTGHEIHYTKQMSGKWTDYSVSYKTGYYVGCCAGSLIACLNREGERRGGVS